MVCGFCPGSGSPSEKTFNRADVFKRHLMSVHNVEQTAPNSRKKGSPSGSSRKYSSFAADGTGKCSTCSNTFQNAQAFYNHLDDCVYNQVIQEDPAAAQNEKNLASVERDPAVEETMRANALPISADYEEELLEDEDENEDEDEDLADDATDSTWKPNARSGKGSIKRSGSGGSSSSGKGSS
jgi:hypothetical protein